MLAAYLPKTFTTLSGYTRRQFLADLQAGVVVGIVAIPLAIAFAIASGVAPEKGLVTAVVAGFLISFLGGSRVQIGGPTGAFVVIVYGIVAKYGVDGLTICTVMAGFLLIAMGLARFGGAIKFIPYPVVTGFTSGIAVIIFSSQIKDLLGLAMGAIPGAVSREVDGVRGRPAERLAFRRRRGARLARHSRALAEGFAHGPQPDRRHPRGLGGRGVVSTCPSRRSAPGSGRSTPRSRLPGCRRSRSTACASSSRRP